MSAPTSLEGRRVLVTGAAQGLGLTIAERIIDLGGSVVVADVQDEAGEHAVAALGDAARYEHLDVSSDADWATVCDRVTDGIGGLDGLVNNAALLDMGPLEQIEPDRARRLLEVNLLGPLLGIRAVAPLLRASGGGSIVNIASTAALQGYANLGSYVASKWGLRGLTKAAALELGPLGIRVNSIHPGPIRTPMIAGLDADSIAATQPIARVGEPEEVTAMLLYLLADATYSTGHEFIIDGGAVIGQVVKTVVEQG